MRFIDQVINQTKYVMGRISLKRNRDWWDHLEERAHHNEFGSKILFMRPGLF